MIVMTAGDTMGRDAILTRYRHLRAISTRHHSAALEFLSRQAILEQARRLGLTVGKTLVAESEEELTLAFDLAIYTAPAGRSRAIDRYRAAARLDEGSDEALVLDAMCRARFSVWRIERRHETVGFTVSDVIRQAEAWLVDESLERTAPEGAAIAARLCRPEAFAMTSGVVVPVDREMLEEALDEALPRVHGTPEQVADDRRFAAAFYRAALERGLLAGGDDE
jgi:hypothetical protein